MPRIQIGVYRLETPQTFHDASYECAAWCKDTTVEPGDYPVTCEFGSDGRAQDRSLHVALPGTCTGAHFGSYFGGVAYGSYDSSREVGQPSTYHIRPYSWMIAAIFLNPAKNAYDREVQARWIPDPTVIEIRRTSTSTRTHDGTEQHHGDFYLRQSMPAQAASVPA